MINLCSSLEADGLLKHLSFIENVNVVLKKKDFSTGYSEDTKAN